MPRIALSAGFRNLVKGEPADLVGRHVLCDVVAQEAENGSTYTHPRNFRDAEMDEVFEPGLYEEGEEEDEEDDLLDEDDEDDEDLFA